MTRHSIQYQSTNPFLAQSDVYRYGFQGQEEDAELWSGSVSYKYRVEDARLGRFFSVDPLFSKFPDNGPYVFSENRLVDSGELEGLERYYAADGTFLGSIRGSQELRVVRSESLDEMDLVLLKMNIERIDRLPVGKDYEDLEARSSKVFRSPDAAAKHFSNTYNYDMNSGKYPEEHAANIYEFPNPSADGSVLYVLGNVVKGKMDIDGYGESVNPGKSKFYGLAEPIAVVHTHGKDDLNVADEKFSDNPKFSDDCGNCLQEMMDKNYARYYQRDVYLATPSGKFMVFRPNGEKNSRGPKGAGQEINLGYVRPDRRAHVESNDLPVEAK